MEKMRFLMASCAGTLIYVIVSLLGGKDGVFANRQLEAQKALIVAHTAEVQKINDELSLENEILYRDSAAIKAQARQLDLISDGERLVKVNGLDHDTLPLHNSGSVLLRQDIFYLPEWVCKLFGVLVFVLVLLILVLKDFARSPAAARIKSESAKATSGAQTLRAQGIPIYDMRKI
jgi:cell division protein FtsB